MNRKDQHPGDADPHQLDSFRTPQESSGISLEQLNAAFAQMLDRGSIPYAPAETNSAAEAPLLAAESNLGDDSTPADTSATDWAVTPRGILEAALFVGNPANEPLRPTELAQHMRGVRPAEIDDLVAQLNDEYRANGCPYQIVNVGAGYRLTLDPAFVEVRDRCYSRQRRVRLSAAAMEVLSIVAYNQPVATAEVDRLRGKTSSALLRQLVRRQLLNVERSDSPGRVSNFRTTDRFLELFGLSRIEDLPRSEEIERR